MVNIKVMLIGLFSAFLLVSVLLVSPSAAASIKKRSPENICKPGARCGWYVYNKQTRHLEDSHTACQCPVSEHCARAEDDVSISAYVYRCAPLTTTTQPIESKS